MYQELGRLGAYRWGGWFYEEFLLELRGRKGVEMFKEMSENDDIIGAILFAIEMLMRQVEWSVKEAGNNEADCKRRCLYYRRLCGLNTGISTDE
jgi:hypothetical protein